VSSAVNTGRSIGSSLPSIRSVGGDETLSNRSEAPWTKRASKSAEMPATVTLSIQPLGLPGVLMQLPQWVNANARSASAQGADRFAFSFLRWLATRLNPVNTAESANRVSFPAERGRDSVLGRVINSIV
jgi:hypothetical protein